MLERVTQLSDEFAVIDLDTGTVLGTNLVVVAMPESVEDQESILSSDSAAHDYGMHNGIPMYVSLDDLPDIPE